LKKYYSVFHQIIKKYELDNGCVGDLSVCSMENTNTMWNVFKPYLNDLKDCGANSGQGCFAPGGLYKYLNGIPQLTPFDNSSYFAKGIMADGTAISLNIKDNKCNFDNTLSGNPNSPLYHLCGYFHVDVNGHKLPNQWGRDMFFFYITPKGILPGGIEDSQDGSGCDPEGPVIGLPLTSGAGACALTVLEQGAMKY
jgi:hypothetical protein